MQEKLAVNTSLLLTKENEPTPNDGLHLAIHESGQNLAAIEELKKIRAEFVRAQGWFPDSPDRDDTDRYDANARTIHFAAHESPEKKPFVSMRLTQIDSFEEALSWDMVENNPDMAAEVRDIMWDEETTLVNELDRRAADGNLWDLTRLVHPVEGRADVEQLLTGLVEMIGAGIDRVAKTNPDKIEEMTWIFTITPTVKSALKFLGIRHEELTSGKISAHDHKKSHFCVAYPVEGLYILRDDPNTPEMTMQHLEDGLRKANAL